MEHPFPLMLLRAVRPEFFITTVDKGKFQSFAFRTPRGHFTLAFSDEKPVLKSEKWDWACMELEMKVRQGITDLEASWEVPMAGRVVVLLHGHVPIGEGSTHCTTPSETEAAFRVALVVAYAKALTTLSKPTT
ncbi:hypothetical protein [Deinococcus misasensis]|uniref:hypothetical protein n=1 Tax=Deinococcus misasensis TaxID=392413 RepID=UPI0005584594|nr:hypothetical protein [Deinococcus misasensis]